jgi:hypothetical protein
MRAMTTLACLPAAAAWHPWAPTLPGGTPGLQLCGAEGLDGSQCAAKAHSSPAGATTITASKPVETISPGWWYAADTLPTPVGATATTASKPVETSFPGWWSAAWEGFPAMNFSAPSPPPSPAGGRRAWTTWVWMRFHYYGALSWAAQWGYEYCGTLCATAYLSAQWLYWFLVGLTVVLLGNMTRVTCVWVLLPLGRLGGALFLYLRGDTSWATVREAQGAVSAPVA